MAAYAQPSFAPREVFSRVELSVSCSNLKDLDHFSKSDPCVFLYEKKGQGEWSKLDRTEVIDNNLNPKVKEQAASSFSPLAQDNACYRRSNLN